MGANNIIRSTRRNIHVGSVTGSNSPVQFGEYGAGDIKYRDVNKDGKITEIEPVHTQ